MTRKPQAKPNDDAPKPRDDGRFKVEATIDGRRHYFYGPTLKKAQNARDAAKAVANRDGGLPERRALGELIDRWMALGDWKPKTRDQYEKQIKVIRAHFGEKTQLAAIKPEAIERFLSSYRDRPRTAQLLFLRLSQLFDLAVRYRWLPTSPMTRVVKPKHQYARKDVWPVADLQQFLGNAVRWRVLWLVAVATGCRPGEIRGMQWGDLDFVAGTLAVRRNVQNIAGKDVVTSPKTKAGMRSVGLPPQAVEELRAWQERQHSELDRLGVTNPDQWVWTNEDGRLLDYFGMRSAFERDAKRAGVDGSPHQLRHQHASLLIAGGAPLTLVARRLGHSTPGITANVYSHWLTEDDRPAADLIARLLPGASAALPPPAAVPGVGAAPNP